MRDEPEILSEGFAVEYYDPPSKMWRQRGPLCTHVKNARSLANKLFKLKYEEMAVRVFYREVVYELKTTKGATS